MICKWCWYNMTSPSFPEVWRSRWLSRSCPKILGHFSSPEGAAEGQKCAVSSGFWVRSSRMSKAWVVFFSQWRDMGWRMNRQHLQAISMMWLSSLRPLCHSHIVFDQKYPNKKWVWSVDPDSATCPPATRSTGQRCLDAEVLLAWKEVKKVGVWDL